MANNIRNAAVTQAEGLMGRSNDFWAAHHLFAVHTFGPLPEPVLQDILAVTRAMTDRTQQANEQAIRALERIQDRAYQLGVGIRIEARAANSLRDVVFTGGATA